MDTSEFHKVYPASSTRSEPERCSVVQRIPPSDLRPWTGMPSYSYIQVHGDTDTNELRRYGRELGMSVAAVQFNMFQIYENVRHLNIAGVLPPCAPNVELNMSPEISDRERLKDGYRQTLRDYDTWCTETLEKLNSVN